MVYIVRMGKTPYFKIGYTKQDDIAQRLGELQTACPEKLTVHRLIENGDNDLERKLHSRFLKARTTGGSEWFKLAKQDLEWLSMDDLEMLIATLDAELARRSEVLATERQPIVKDKFVGAWVEAKTYDRLRLLAQLRAVTMSELLRHLINDAAERAIATPSNGHGEPKKEPA